VFTLPATHDRFRRMGSVDGRHCGRHCPSAHDQTAETGSAVILASAYPDLVEAQEPLSGKFFRKPVELSTLPNAVKSSLAALCRFESVDESGQKR